MKKPAIFTFIFCFILFSICFKHLNKVSAASNNTKSQNEYVIFNFKDSQIISKPEKQQDKKINTNKKQEIVQNLKENEINNKIDKQEEKDVIISVEKYGRDNPFQPFREKSIVLDRMLNNPEGTGIEFGSFGISLPEPPEFNEDPELSKLLNLKVNGILYDNLKPSAIINVEDNDYLVHKGDKIFEFYIQDILPDKVAIKYENNVYKAKIGEIITGIIKEEPVSNFRSKFAGSKNAH